MSPHISFMIQHQTAFFNRFIRIILKNYKNCLKKAVASSALSSFKNFSVKDISGHFVPFISIIIRCQGQKSPTLMPTDCSVLRTPTILPNIRISWDYHPTFMLISGRVKRSFTHL
ncbi:hypothetical protein RUMLAC_00802 [[Ruminococcus] lactaris ATCC 29176]|uniref:Uncharacterized protein n=1 Tax=[Ruminococcus] lactaris ATCC 29176 TaxID=471875 RepID=B5CMW6_9FIRM|nr:hypothetical protein RUMLAC_00802 [[Ruminococcus] lactaris ATCC 29176]